MHFNPHRKAGLLALLPLLVSGTGCGDSAKTPVDGDTAFVNVNVVPMTSSRVLQGMTVVIDQGLVTSISPTAETAPAAGMRVIDGGGRYLIPGLADMHVHLWDEVAPSLYVAYGVTTVRNMWGEPWTLEMRDRIRAGDLVGPRLMTAGRIVDGAPRIWQGSDEVADAETARAVVKRQLGQGFDFIKVYSRLGRPAFDAIVSATKEAGIDFAGHTPIDVDLRDMLQAGPKSIEHLSGWNLATRKDGVDLGNGYRSPEMIEVGRRLVSGELAPGDVFDAAKRREMAALAAETGVWNVPTLIVKKKIPLTRVQAEAEFRRDEMRYVSANTRDFWNPNNDFRKRDRSDEELGALQAYFPEAKQRVKALYDAGAPLLIGSDATNPFVFHGLSVHEELELFVEAGLPPYAALEAATAAPARFFDANGIWGVIAEGASADLVLLSANPLDDISNSRRIEGVMQRGVWRDRTQLDELLAGAAAAYALPPVWFEGRDSLSREFDIETGEVIAYRHFIDDRERSAERLAVLGSDGRYEVFAQGEHQGFVRSEYSIGRSVVAGKTQHTSYRQPEIVPSRNIAVDCGTRSCSLRIDGDEIASVDGEALLFLVDGPSDLAVLSAYLQGLAVGDSVRVEAVRFVRGGQPHLMKEEVGITRQPDEPTTDENAETGMHRYDIESEANGDMRVWVEDGSGLPVRMERLTPDPPTHVWERMTAGSQESAR